MSLLMEALKKAERAKQEQVGAPVEAAPSAGPTDEGLSLQPRAPEEPPASKPADAFPLLLSELDEPAKTTSKPAGPESEEIKPAASGPAPAEASGLSLIEEVEKAPVKEEVRPAVEARSPASAASTALSLEPQPVKAEEAPPPEKVQVKVESAPVKPAPPNAPRQTMGASGNDAAKVAVEENKQIAVAQQKAKTVFASKQPSRKRRIPAIAVIGVVAVLVATAGGGYFYWQLSGLDTPAAVPVNVPPREAVVVSSTPASASAAVPAAVSAVGTPAEPAPPVQASAIPVKPVPIPPAVAVQPPAIAAAVPVQQHAAESSLQQRPPVSSQPDKPVAEPKPVRAAQPQTSPRSAPVEVAPIQIQQGTSAPAVSSLASAYLAFESGDLANAQLQYLQVLRQDANNRDALLGLAAIGLQRGQPAQAAAYYAKLLELDPLDPDAMAGLVSVQPQADPVQSESRLKKILAQHPQAAAVHFALGNLYAQQSRWADAQQSYFRAYTGASGNADYAFNLAVSLDRVSQEKLALDFYRRALALAQNGTGNFDKAAVQNRIKELEVPAASE